MTELNAPKYKPDGDDDDLDEDEDSDRPSPAEQRRQLAEAGDFRGLFNMILHAPSGMLDRPEAFAQLLSAFDVASRKDPHVFTAELFQKTVAFTAYVSSRQEEACLAAMQPPSGCGPTRPDLPDDFLEKQLPQLRGLHDHLAGLMQAWASCSRLWHLQRDGRPRKVKAGLDKSVDSLGYAELRSLSNGTGTKHSNNGNGRVH